MNQTQQMQTVSYPSVVVPEQQLTPYSEFDERTTALVQSTYQLAEFDAFRDKLKAALAMQAMSNTATLSTMESMFNQIAPAGSDAYHYIVQSYARWAASQFMGGNW